MINNLPIYVMIGTRAQFIKVAPIMRKMLDQGIPYTLIYTAQHKENINEILDLYQLPAPDITLYERKEANTKSSFLLWFITILLKSLFQAKRYIKKPGILLTHGDTFTTWLAALMGKRVGCIIGHIESGCRSFNLLSPFPEEISRLITFKLSDIYFCADEWTMKNLEKYPGLKINMGTNTILDSVRFALHNSKRTIFEFEKSPYVLVSIHRFENIFTSRFTKFIIPYLVELSSKHHLVITLHPTTRERLNSLGLFEKIKNHPNITIHERFGFVEWINLCKKAEFVITDGGSNQEELSYLGTPTLLFRNETEWQLGLGENIVLSKFDRLIINNFTDNYKQYRKKSFNPDAQPSEIVIKTICDKNIGILGKESES